jgi:hypothetical protein
MLVSLLLVVAEVDEDPQRRPHIGYRWRLSWWWWGQEGRLGLLIVHVVVEAFKVGLGHLPPSIVIGLEPPGPQEESMAYAGSRRRSAGKCAPRAVPPIGIAGT